MLTWDGIKFVLPVFVVVGAAIGWFVNDWLKRRASARLLIEKKTDFQRALRAEIRAFSDSPGMTVAGLDGAIRKAGEQVRDHEDGEKFIPFIPRRKSNVVFEAILPEIHILPEKVVYPVVVYYAQIRLIENITEDLRTPEYAAMSAERRCQLLVDYLKLVKYALVLARKALFSLEDGIERQRKRRQ